MCGCHFWEYSGDVFFFEGLDVLSKLPLLEDLCQLQAFGDPGQSIVARCSIWTHLTLRVHRSQKQVVVEVMVFLAVWIISCLLNICLIFEFSSLRSWHVVCCPVFLWVRSSFSVGWWKCVFVLCIRQTWYRACCLRDCVIYISCCDVGFGSHCGCLLSCLNLLFILKMCAS